MIYKAPPTSESELVWQLLNLVVKFLNFTDPQEEEIFCLAILILSSYSEDVVVSLLFTVILGGCFFGA